jgi:hypothetical protein
LNAGVRNLSGYIEDFKVSAIYSRWIHRELENEELATEFDNKLVNIRMTVGQRKNRYLTETSGFQFSRRDYSAEGEEALSPPVTSNGFAFFTLQEISLESMRLQFGGRVDYTGYDPVGMPGRSFTGFWVPRECISRFCKTRHSWRTIHTLIALRQSKSFTITALISGTWRLKPGIPTLNGRLLTGWTFHCAVKARD